MKSVNQLGLTIAIAYYDGEEEGFARLDGQHVYFRRVEEADLENTYIAVSIDEQDFFSLLSTMRLGEGSGGVVVYAGNDENSNTLIDSLVKKYEFALETKGARSVGETFLKSKRVE